MSRRRRAAAVAALALALPPRAARAEGWAAPPDARARPNPVPPSPVALAKGRALYLRHCAKCHGPQGRGDGSAARFGPEPASDLTAPAAPFTDGEVFWKVTAGRKVGPEVLMPSFAKDIPDEEDRWRIALFIRTLGEAPGGSETVAPPSPSRGRGALARSAQKSNLTLPYQ